MSTRDDEMAFLRSALGLTTDAGTITDLRAVYYAKGAAGTLPVVLPSGATADRPEDPVEGQVFIDTDLGFPIFWVNDGWVDATGADPDA